jgi:hypothetical protein
VSRKIPHFARLSNRFFCIFLHWRIRFFPRGFKVFSVLQSKIARSTVLRRRRPERKIV